MKNKLFSVQNMAIIAMLAAIAYLAMFFGRIPVVLFLKYEPKDVVIIIGGFLFGPFSAFIMSVLVSFIEMFTVSDTGWIGFVMNVVSTCSFVCTASIIYKFKRNIKTAIVGLVVGVLVMTVIMLLWNYFLTPIFMKIPREVVAQMLVPTFLPFNLMKGGLNAAMTMLLYKPLTNILRKTSLMPKQEIDEKGKINKTAWLVSLFVFITCILFMLVLQGHI